MPEKLHIYGQLDPHDVVEIAGTKKALLQLARLLLAAAGEETAISPPPLATGDFESHYGEGYILHALRVEADFNELATPYLGASSQCHSGTFPSTLAKHRSVRIADEAAGFTVEEIVNQYLQLHDLGGLFNEDGACACRVGALAPCGEINTGCQAGREAPCYCGEGHDFHVTDAPPAVIAQLSPGETIEDYMDFGDFNG